MSCFSSLAPSTSVTSVSSLRSATRSACSSPSLPSRRPGPSTTSTITCSSIPPSVHSFSQSLFFIARLCAATSNRFRFHLFSSSSPSAPYFLGCLSQEDLNEMNIELIRNTLYKAYLQDFYRYCQVLGGDTAEVMGEILQVPSHLPACSLFPQARVLNLLLLLLRLSFFLSSSPSSSVRGGQAR